MIKMNFDNRLNDDDQHLIHLLKVENEEFPTDQLEQRVMTRISATHAEKKFAYKPLRIPLVIMTFIALLLLVPLLIPTALTSASLKPLSEFLAYRDGAILKYAVWCWLAVVVSWIFGLLSQARRNLA